MRTNKNYIRYINEARIDTSGKHKGESMEQYVNRVYRLALAATFAMHALLEDAVYKAHGMLVDTDCNRDNVEYMLSYYESFSKRIDSVMTYQEGVMQDFRYYVQKHMKGHVEKILLEIGLQVNSEGVGKPYLASHIIGVSVLADIFMQVWRHGTELIAHAIQVPESLQAAFRFLKRMDRRTEALVDELVPELDGKSLTSGDGVVNAALDIVNTIFYGTVIEEALAYAYQENDIKAKKDITN